MHVQLKYAIDRPEARRVIVEHGWARVIAVGAPGLRATYGLFLLEDSEDDEIVVAAHFARADPQCVGSRSGPSGSGSGPLGWRRRPPHHHPELAALMRRLSLAKP